MDRNRKYAVHLQWEEEEWEKAQRLKAGQWDGVTCIELIIVQYVTELDYIQNSCPLLQIHFTCNNGHSINAYWVNLAFWVTEEENKTDNLICMIS